MPPAKGKGAAAAAAASGGANARPGLVLKARWRLGELLGEGACGQVYEVTDATGGQKEHSWVIKLTPLPSAPPTSGKKSKNKKDDALKRNADTLYFEQLVYKNYMMDVPNIPALPTMLAYGEDQGYRFLVMQRLGRDLCQEFEAKGKRFSPFILSTYGRQMLQTLRRLHEKQLIFIDVKPENFMLGLPGTKEENQIFMVDFGLVEKFTGTNGGHKPEAGGGGGGIGTPLFLSLACHQGSAPARRDDVEALGMVLLFFARGGNLPWGTATSDADCLAKKKSAKLSELVAGIPGGDVLKSFIELARSTVFEAMPAYDKFDRLLQSLAKAKDTTATAAAAGGGSASSGASRKRKSGAAAAAAASSADENQDEENVGGGRGGGAAAGGGKKKGRQSEPAAAASSSTSTTTAGWLASIAANAGKYVLESITGSGGKDRRRGDGDDEKDLVDLTIDSPPPFPSSSSSSKCIRNKTGSAAAAAKRGGKKKEKEEEVIQIDDDDDEEEAGSKASVASSQGFSVQVIDGPHKGQSFDLTAGGKAVWIGRDASHGKNGGISLPSDGQVKPKHAKLEAAGRDSRTTSLKVVPSGTDAKVLVNNVKVGKTGRQIFPNDLVQVGNTVLALRRA